LQSLGIAASDARRYPEYAPDYMATFFSDPDGLRLEVTNYRHERRQLHGLWDAIGNE
jgi:glyoxylase I family protein